tara:strand:+ start:11481 stop:12413 length:933 start_codon:yes stop_codon:yes gene_type:complete
MEVCQNCSAGYLKPTGQVVKLRDVLLRWENEVSISFPEEVLSSYSDVIDTPIVLHTCSNCDFSPFLPAVAGNGSFYSAITSAEGGYYVGDKWEFRRAIKDIERYRCKRVLDFGCGSGEFLSRLQEHVDVDAYGFDFNPVGSNAAREKGYQLIHEFDAANLPGAPFDAITMFQVLEHLSSPFETLEKLKSLLRPGGLFIVSVPDCSGPIRHFENALTELPPHHVTRWYGDSLRTCFTQRQFDVIDIKSEPLPNYLWDSYLPVMLTKDLLPSAVGGFINRIKVTRTLISVLQALRVKSLPIRGHTLYGAFRN